jgi:hypothetical protein
MPFSTLMVQSPGITEKFTLQSGINIVLFPANFRQCSTASGLPQFHGNLMERNSMNDYMQCLEVQTDLTRYLLTVFVS